MKTFGVFPVGQQVEDIMHIERTPKKVFVLRVYASAVHARWLGVNNKTIVYALAVASETYIFWRGDNAESIIQRIIVSENLGKFTRIVQIFHRV